MNPTHPHLPCLLTLYEAYLENQDIVRFVHGTSKHYTPGTLQRLATHPDHRMRCAAVLSLGYLGDYGVHETLGEALQDEDRAVRRLADTACRSAWNRVGGQEQREMLVDTIRLNAAGNYREVLQQTASLLDDVPSFAEAWYHRGSAWFQLDDFRQAIQDWRTTLGFNSYHFVAATAIGDAYLRLRAPTPALEAFRHALRIHPDLDRVRTRVVELTRQVEGG